MEVSSQEVTYYESHVTIEPVFGERLELFTSLCNKHQFRVAKLLMQRHKEDEPTSSTKDSFCTGRSSTFVELKTRMTELVAELRIGEFKPLRAKIEAVVFDERYT